MKRVLLKSSAFVRGAKKYSKTHPEAADDLRFALQLRSIIQPQPHDAVSNLARLDNM